MNGSVSPIKISVIIPVYQVVPWIDKCIISLKAQKLDGLEFIFIDDCSTDGSMQKVERFAVEDRRVHILYNEKNVGPGVSRNKGIDAASGKYLSFVDPDDWLADDFYQLLYERAAATDDDIIKGKHAVVNEWTGDPLSLRQQYSLNKYICKSLDRKQPLWSSFTYEHQSAIYKKTLFENGLSRFGMTMNSEDSTFLLRCCSRASGISFEPDAIYYYYNRPSSASSSFSFKHSVNELISLGEKIGHFLGRPIDEAARHYLQKYISSYSIHFYYFSKQQTFSKAEYDLYLSEFIMTIQKLPDYQILTRNYKELSVLFDYGWVIPRKTIDFIQGFEYCDIEEWLRFIEQQPDLTRDYFYNCACVIIRAYASCLRNVRKAGRKGTKELTRLLHVHFSCMSRQKRWLIRFYYPLAAFILGIWVIFGKLS